MVEFGWSAGEGESDGGDPAGDGFGGASRNECFESGLTHEEGAATRQMWATPGLGIVQMTTLSASAQAMPALP
jgi:hypothetical protein